ncbi:plasmid mobilization relaxosome protein MobC [Aurantimonas sp. VKM B-3413]|uniref:plasmid mobilization relaxosome protein MobC n=1 Tax=Aurantimonas sp. VKM B-3413 TaxID=2779401 RepID=UPI001E544522|nr:plasmid mobilization relaxosome protein MobC [Aurantimonas sp. VKM B-3413]MCB8838078.1 MobC family plasmid mobilization relaxosome protein [Aurantimonas sp. VKM B-3413]
MAGTVEAEKAPKRKRGAPFSIRLTEEERARLAEEAAGEPLGTYIKVKVLGSGPAPRKRRTGQSIEDRKALAQALGLLGQSRLAANINQLARAANTGSLPVTPETESELTRALSDVRNLRLLLLAALGLKAEEPA